jgi:hypothetical protein
MDALAKVLIKLDVTPSQWAEISRASFVKAGVSIVRRKRSGRPHVARVAALTALPRSEVRKIIETNYDLDSKRVDYLPRPLRVVWAWRTSPKYVRRGKSEKLKMSGKAPSFEALCRDFSGDIPHRAIASELLSRNLIRIQLVGRDEYVSLIRSANTKDTQAMDALIYITSFLDSALASDRVLVRRRQTIASPEKLSAAYFQNSIVSRVTSFIDELPIERSARNRKSDEDLEVFAVVTRRTRDS